MKRLYRVLKFKISLLALLMLFAVVCYVSVGRIALSLLPDYRLQLEQYLSQQLQLPVTIQGLSGAWVGFDPVFTVEALVVNGADNLAISRVDIRVAIVKSLLAQALRLKSVTVDAAQVALQQEEHGAWRLAGVALGDGADDQQEPLPLSLIQLFDGANLTLNNSSVVVVDQKQRIRTWQLPLVSVSYRDDQVFASGQILELGGAQPLVNFSLEGAGVKSLSQIQGLLYIEARSADFFDDVLKAYQWQQISVQDLDASARMWLAFDGLQVTEVQANLQLRQLNWQLAQQSLPPLVNVAAQVQWRNTEAGSELAVHWHGFNWLGQTCVPTAAWIGLVGQTTELKIGALDVRCLSSLALALGLPNEHLRPRLETSEPQGLLENISITLNNAAESDSSFVFAAELNDLSLKAYHATPALSGLDGYVAVDATGGSVAFNSRRFELAFPELFLAPWPTKQAEGVVSWKINSDEVEVYSEGLRLRLADESLVYGDFILRLNPPDKEDYLSLALGMQDIPFERVTNFVPYHAVGENLYHWLGKSLSDGVVSRGVYYGYGSTERQHPPHSFTSSIYLETEQGSLLFADGWPKLADLEASITLQNGALSVHAQHATIQQTKLSSVVAQLPEKIGGVPAVLSVTANLQAGPSDLQYWLQESPIATHTKTIAEQLRLDGPVDVALDLGIPMEAAYAVDYRVSCRFNGATIEHPGAALTFANVRGLLEVSSAKGVLATGVRTELFGEPATLSIATRARVGDAAGQGADLPSSGAAQLTDTVLSLNGRTSVAALLKNYQVPPILGLSGAFNYQAVLSLPSTDPRRGAGSDYPVLNVSSDLAGLARDWPVPFDKSPEQVEQLDLSLLIKPNQMYLHLGLEAESIPGVAAELLFVDHEFSFGEVLIGGAPSSNNISSGLGVRAVLPTLELTPWVDFVEQLSASTKALAEQRILQQLDLSINEVEAYGQHFKQVQAALSRDQQAWLVNLNGPDIAGRIALPTADQPLSIRLLQLSLRSEPAAQEALSEVAAPYDPKAIPALYFETQQLTYNGLNFGAWSTSTEPNEQGVIFRDLVGTNGDTRVTGQLNWQHLDNSQPNSILTLDAAGGDVDRFLASMGWSSALTSHQFNAQVALVWADRPAAFDLARVSGSIGLMMQDGVLKTADEKTGALRVFGILNADTIKRRLTLDFSDLYKSGVSYDQLSVKAKIDQGQLTLFEPLTIEGPSSNYVINGMADLTKQTLDMDMLVELPFAQNVPLAGLLLGAPQVGGAVWVIDKLLGEPLSAITTARYDITGSWDEPEMNLHQVINASKKKRTRKGEKE